MARCIAFVLVILLLPTLADAQSLQGVWRLVEIESGGGLFGEGTVTEDQLQPGFLILTDAHYSKQFVYGAGPRSTTSQFTTDAEIAAGARRFFSNAGTYEIDGSSLTFQFRVSLNPNVMTNTTLATITQLTADTLEYEVMGANPRRMLFRRVE